MDNFINVLWVLIMIPSTLFGFCAGVIFEKCNNVQKKIREVKSDIQFIREDLKGNYYERN